MVCIKNGKQNEQETDSRESESYAYHTYESNKKKHSTKQWSWTACLWNVFWLGYQRRFFSAFLFLLIFAFSQVGAYILGWNYAVPFVNVTYLSLVVYMAGMLFLGIYGNQLYYNREHVKTKRYIGLAASLCAAGFFYFISHYFYPTSIDIIKLVKRETLYEYPLYSIGAKFEQYFYNTKWAYQRGADGLEIVEFRGTAVSDKSEVVLQFIVDYSYKEIELYTLSVDGEIQNEKEVYALMDRIFDVKTPFNLDDELEDDIEKKAL
ncbi:DUF2628 domain-containing protein [Bacillus sp. 165]|uniref:DUF2628 domain-containing protein n=1 Tax=Bacillus sp. 165 TaxID=1529117 RepID=UPI001ADAB2EA|nr:DUF2628 domain-containing protein [Bacillus sp. 165]